LGNKNFLRHSTLLLLLLSIIQISYGQNITEPLNDFDIEESNIPVNYDEQLEHLQYLINHPVNLNKATLYDLEISQLFHPQTLNALLEHRAGVGPLLSIYELQAIPYFTLDYIHQILPYVTLNKSIEDYHLKFSKLISHGNYQVFLRYSQSFPKKKGYLENNYLGSPNNIYLRYRYNYSNKFYYGVTMEKDAGETMFKPNSKQGFDFYSYHVFWRMNSKIKAIALGDYHINFGQGLVIWTGFGFNKSSNIQSVKKESNSLKPYSALNEINFLRGAAINIQLNTFQLTAFASHKAIDANIAFSDSSNSILENNSIQTSGLHRTESELANKGNLKESIFGFNLQYKKRDKHIGLNLVSTIYDEAIKNSNRAYNQFYFQNKHLLNSSLDYHFLIKSFHFFGETAMSFSSDQLGGATINGVLFNPDKNIDLSLLHRFYSPKYQNNFYANAFAESSRANNEHGLYFGTQIKTSKKTSVASYIDYYLFPWLNFNSDKPSKGYDIMFRFDFKQKKKFETYIAFRRETKEANVKIDLGSNDAILITSRNRKYLNAYFPNIDLSTFQSLRISSQINKQEIEAATFVIPTVQQRLRWHIMYKANKNWTFQSRIEFSFFNDKINRPQSGVLFYQDINFNKMEIPIAFSLRLVLFDIPQFNSRIYTYENDVLTAFSIPALFNAGIRYYINMHYKITRNLDLWLRFSHTYYNDVSQKGTGNDEVNQNKIYDLKMQLRLKF
jgi:hypothetical protein